MAKIVRSDRFRHNGHPHGAQREMGMVHIMNSRESEKSLGKNQTHIMFQPFSGS